MPEDHIKEFRYEVVIRVAGDVPPNYRPLDEMSLMSTVLGAARRREDDGEDDSYASIVGVDVRRA